MRVDVSFLPPEQPPSGRTCLVVDVLRATSSIAVLLECGMEGIYPAASIEEGRARRERLQRELGREVMLCGERHALPPEGYDFGNSPSELASAPLRWREAVVATTNGTPALLACASASLTLAAAAVNAGAVTAAALAAGDDVLVVCAGEAGEPSDDDTFAAAVLVRRLVEAGAAPDANARLALDRFEAAGGDLPAALRATRHGAGLAELGFADDIDFCGTTDRVAVAGALRREEGGFVLRPHAPPVDGAAGHAGPSSSGRDARQRGF